MSKPRSTATNTSLFPSDASEPVAPRLLTSIAWLAWLASLAVLAAHAWLDRAWSWAGLVRVDGVTAVMWAAITFFSGIVHSYARRYMAGDRDISAFFGRTTAFTASVMLLVAADHLALFVASWLAMGWIMADLIGHVRRWQQAQQAGALARRYFLASSALVASALGALAWGTGVTTIEGVVSAVDAVPSTTWGLVVAALIAAAMIQSALVPFHTWLLSSMTAPTPASALMHAGFVNAGGLLLVRFGPVVSVDAVVMGGIAALGALSAIAGKLLKSVRSDVKRKLGCSTVGQMGFMIMQAGLGFFSAAIAHLFLHGFYKAYLFLSSGEQVEQTTPSTPTELERGSTLTRGVVTLLAAAAGGGLFVWMTGKGAALDGGAILTLLVVLTTLHAARHLLAHTSVSASFRYLAVPFVLMPAVALYALIYNGVSSLMANGWMATAPVEWTVFHGVVAAIFVIAYVIVEMELYQRSERLYTALLNATRPASETLTTSKEAYRD